MIIFAKRYLLNLLKERGFDIDFNLWPISAKRHGESVIIGDTIAYVSGTETFETTSYRKAIKHLSL